MNQNHKPKGQDAKETSSESTSQFEEEDVVLSHETDSDEGGSLSVDEKDSSHNEVKVTVGNKAYNGELYVSSAMAGVSTVIIVMIPELSVSVKLKDSDQREKWSVTIWDGNNQDVIRYWSMKRDDSSYTKELREEFELSLIHI